MHKLQVFVFKSHKLFNVGLVRNPAHISDLRVDFEQQALVLTAPLNSSEAHEHMKIWQYRFSGKWRFLWWYLLNKGHRSLKFLQEELSHTQAIEVNLFRIRQILSGRLLSEKKLIGTLRQEGFWPGDISKALDLGVYRGELKQLPGLSSAPWGRQICTRCESENLRQVPCLSCGNSGCYLCLECRSMGEHRSCTTLLTLMRQRESSLQKPEHVKLKLTYQLTAAQQNASNELVQFWQQDYKKALVWAACGAGKTEVTFEVIRQVLSAGGRVLFAIPRQDIVREMTTRLRIAFPEVTVASHYGGKPWLAPGNLVVATTHQVLHFYQRFQFAILDEVDAFPYQGNEMLRFGLKRALLPSGKLVEMTATPDTLHGYEKVITIPARYHGFPLPEPEILKTNLPNWNKLQPRDLPIFLLEILQDNHNPWLVFVPTIEACFCLQEVLTEATGKKVSFCHSKAKDRTEVVSDFKAGSLDIVVTTSVLERGVNFPGVGVIVLYADHVIFTISALVQIAGRVGRHAKFPCGRVLYIGAKASRSMKKALDLIQDLNQEALKRGLLRDEIMA